MLRQRFVRSAEALRAAAAVVVVVVRRPARREGGRTRRCERYKGRERERGPLTRSRSLSLSLLFARYFSS